MSVSIYLSNQIVQAVVGTRSKTGKPKQIFTDTAPEGSIINGIVMDADSLAAFLKSFWDKNHLPKNDVILVVNSNKIASKNIEMPLLGDKKTITYITHEFADMQRLEEDNTLAYTIIDTTPKTKTKRLYAESAPKDQLKEFIDIFNSIGIKLKGIYSGEGNLIGYLKLKLSKTYKTFILQVSSGNIVYNVLFVNGTFKYLNSVRCFNEVGTQGYFEDMDRSLSQLMQFIQTQKLDARIEKVFISGIDRENMEFYTSLIKERDPEASCELLNVGIREERASAIFVVSGLFDFGKESNFLTNFNLKSESKSKLDPRAKKYVGVIVTVLIVMLLAFVTTFAMELLRKNRLNELEEEINMTSAEAMFYDMEAQRRDELSSKYYSINSVVETINSYPICNDEIIKRLQNTAVGLAEIEISSFDANAGIISFSAKSSDVNDIYKYIDRLFDEDMFSSVEHTGYTYDGSDNTYKILVDCILSESTGRNLED